jgi:hypothetical protein
MKKLNQLISFITIFLLTCGVGFTQTITKPKTQSRIPQQAVTPAATGNPVTGSGTVGRIAKWTGVDGSNSFTLGNTNIFEDKFGKVGIGTTTPTSPLTVQGMIETTLGGYKFPDGTIQTTAGLASIFHDTTLKGNGRSTSPLGVAIPLNLFGEAPGGAGVINVLNMVAGGSGIDIAAGSSDDKTAGGTGVIGAGGSTSTAKPAGPGLAGIGGDAIGGQDGAPGGRLQGGSANLGNGGNGVTALGGQATAAGKKGGIGLESTGGDGINGGRGGIGGSLSGGNATAGSGGDGLLVMGGAGFGPNAIGGTGIHVIRGSGSGGASQGMAGEFLGDVQISGDLNVSGTKNFRIDHPLDPENKYLVHAAIESAEVLNIYSGNITTDANGEATISLPEWFEAVNKDIRYQLTVVGTFAQAIVADEVKNNRFTIKTSAPNVKVSWQVTGVRSDAGMLKRPFKTEESKPEQERGTYLNPAAYNQPEERGTEWARHPEIMQKIKQTREKQIQESKQKSQNRNN